MSRLQLITLDLDNTLWDVEKTIRAAERDLIAWLKTHAEPAHQIYVSNDLAALREQTLQQQPNLRHDLSRLRIEILSGVMRKAQYQEHEARNLAEAAFEVFLLGATASRFSWRVGDATGAERALPGLCINQRQRRHPEQASAPT